MRERLGAGLLLLLLGSAHAEDATSPRPRFGTTRGGVGTPYDNLGPGGVTVRPRPNGITGGMGTVGGQMITFTQPPQGNPPTTTSQVNPTVTGTPTPSPEPGPGAEASTQQPPAGATPAPVLLETPPQPQAEPEALLPSRRSPPNRRTTTEADVEAPPSFENSGPVPVTSGESAPGRSARPKEPAPEEREARGRRLDGAARSARGIGDSFKRSLTRPGSADPDAPLHAPQISELPLRLEGRDLPAPPATGATPGPEPGAQTPRLARGEPLALERHPGLFKVLSQDEFARVKERLEPERPRGPALRHVALDEGRRDIRWSDSCAPISGECNPAAGRKSYRKGEFVPPDVLKRISKALAAMDREEAARLSSVQAKLSRRALAPGSGPAVLTAGFVGGAAVRPDSIEPSTVEAEPAPSGAGLPAFEAFRRAFSPARAHPPSPGTADSSPAPRRAAAAAAGGMGLAAGLLVWRFSRRRDRG